MRWLLHLVAIILFVFGVLYAKGWLVSLDLGDSLVCIAAGLAAWAASSFTPPATVRG